MILDLDIGNSRIKWRLSDIAAGREEGGVVLGLSELLAATVEQHQVSRVRIACVRGGDLLHELTELLVKEWQLPVATARVSRECHGVTVAYEDLTRLGVDRWLAMLAAYRDTGGACVIVDCGTAMTLDCIGCSGRHSGGYIVPGLRLIPETLTRNTAIELEGEPDWGLELGNSTAEAIYHGALQMLVSLLEKTVGRELSRLSGRIPLSVYLTGGDAAIFAGFLNLPDVTLKMADGLVFDGLALAIP